MSDLSAVYDGTPKAVTATTDPPGLGVIITYAGSSTPPTNPGSYCRRNTIDSPDHTGSATGLLVITDHGPVATTTPPSRIVGTVGAPLTLAVNAVTSHPPLSYQWKSTNHPLPGKAAATLSLPDFQNTDAGPYTLEITDSLGAVTRFTSFVLPDYGQTQVLAWGGSNTAGQLDTTTDAWNAVAVAAGAGTTYALLGDGTIRAWGLYTPPAGLTDVVAVASGGSHGMALRSNGTVIEWGAAVDLGLLTTPSALTDVIAISGGAGFSAALRSDGTVVAWGYNASGQTNVPAGLSQVAEMAAGYDHVICLRADGTFVGLGCQRWR